MSLDSLLLNDAQRNSLERATAEYEKNVDALASFLEGRGIGKQAAIASRLGCVSDPIPGHERFRGMMSIPYLTPSGVVAMKFRRLNESDKPKYDSPAGQKIRLYNAGILAQPLEYAVICEGEMDAILCTHELGLPAVATWGTNWLEHHPRCFADLDEVVIIADHDVKPDGSTPGQDHAEKIRKTIPGSRVVLPPPGMDLGEWFLSEGREAVLERIGLS